MALPSQLLYTNRIPLLFLIVFTLLAYLPAVTATFIIDDEEYFLHDPLIQSPQGLVPIWTEPLNNNHVWPYIPITRTSFWLEYQTFGSNLPITHSINILLHLFNGLLLWGILKYCRFQGAWLTAGLFLLHPMHVQSVAWIAERKNVMAMFFYLLVIVSYLYFEDTKKIKWYIIALVFFVAALLSKGAAVMLPVVIVFCRLWLHHPWKAFDTIRLIPFFLIALANAGITVWFESYAFGAQSSSPEFNFLERILNAAFVCYFYLNKLIWPHPILFIYPQWEINTSQVSSYLPFISCCFLLIISLWKYNNWSKPIFIIFGSFVAAIFPVLGFFDIAWARSSLVSNHWGYFASLSIIILLGQGITKFSTLLQIHFHKILIGVSSSQKGYSRKLEKDSLRSEVKKIQRNSEFIYLPYVASLGILIILGFLVWNQSSTYQNRETLWQATLKKNPEAWVAHSDLGNLYVSQKKYSKALMHLDKTLNLNPDSFRAYINRGTVFFALHQYEKALEDYTFALRINPENAKAYNNRGNVYKALHQYEKAIKDYTESLKLAPHPERYQNRAELYLDLHQYAKAISDFTQALKLAPHGVEAYQNRGFAYLQLEQHEAAIADFSKVLLREPHLSEALVGRGYALWLVGKPESACRDWKKACKQGECSAWQHPEFQRSCQEFN